MFRGLLLQAALTAAMVMTVAAPAVADTASAKALESIESRWGSAAATWDPDKFAALYTDDALFFGGLPSLYVGSTEIHKYFSYYVGTVKAASIKFVDQQVRKLGPDAFLFQGFGNFHVTLTSGAEFDSVQRTTLLIVRQAGEWKIAQHHFSTQPDAPPIPQTPAASK